MQIREYYNMIELTPLPNSTLTIEVWKPNGFDREEARVNWGCHGSDTPTNAKLFGKALIEASKMATKLTRGYKKYRT